MADHFSGFVWLALICNVSAFTSATRSAEANLIWLMSDSFDGRFLDDSAPQAQQVALPALRGLASRGANFVRSYANSPQCVPSRASMMTGRRTDQIGAWNNQMGLARRLSGPWANDAASPEAIAHRCSLALNQTECEDLSRWVAALRAEDADARWLDATCLRSWSRKICAQMATWQEGVSDETPDVLRALQRAGVEVAVFGKVDIGFGFLDDFVHASNGGFHGGASLPTQTRSANILRPSKNNALDELKVQDDRVHPEDWRVVERCIEWLQRHDKNRRGWLLHCSLDIPHPPFRTNATWLRKVNSSNVHLPASWTDAISDLHPADAYSSVSKHVTGRFSHAEILRLRLVYAAMCAETDFLLGRVLDAAASTGHLDNSTYVLFNSDHGEMALEHRQVYKSTMFEGSSRVPFLLSGPGIKGGAISSLTQLLDVYPTLLEIYSLAPPAWLEGASLLSPPPPRRAVISQYHSNLANTGVFMVRSPDGYKYITYGNSRYGQTPRYRPQLFHVESDPDEIHELAQSPQHAQALAALDAELHAVLDPAKVDELAKGIDHWLYEEWFGHEARVRLHKAFEKAYDGFDVANWKDIEQWRSEP